MNCIITIVADGRRGSPVCNKTGPVSKFIVDSDYLYTRVYQHVRKCKKCDPNAILRAYLDRRITIPKFNGQTSSGLINLAMKYRGLPLWKKDDKLINEFIWRSCDFHKILDYQNMLDSDDVILFMRLYVNFYMSTNSNTKYLRGVVISKCANSRFLPLMDTFVSIFLATGEMPTNNKELVDLSVVCDVMTS